MLLGILNLIFITSVVDGSDGLVLLLTCCVPNLDIVERYLETSGFAISVVVNFGEKGSPESGFMEFIELIVNEPEQQAAFSDTGISDDDDFDVCLILIHGMFRLIDNIISFEISTKFLLFEFIN